MTEHEGQGTRDELDEPSIRITIEPPPTVDERDAVVAAIMALLAERPAAPAVDAGQPSTSRWKQTGRFESVRGLSGGPTRGWGRKDRSKS